MKILKEIYDSITQKAEILETKLGTSRSALFYFSFNVISFFFISLYVKMTKLSGKFYIIGFWRGFFGVVFTQFIFFFSKQSFNAGKFTKILFFRSVLVIQQQFLFFFLTKEIPLSQLWILTNTLPIWAYFIKYFFYGMKVTKREIFGIIISFIGVILVINPTIFLDIFGIKYNEKSILFHIEGGESKYTYAKGLYKIFLCLVYFISCAGIAYGWILIQLIDVPGLMQNGQLFISFIILTVPFRFYFEDNISYNVNEYFQIFIILGIILFLAQVFGVRALTIEKNTGKISLLNYLTVIFSYIFEICSLKEYPSILNLIGMVCILIGLYLVNK